MKSRRLFEFSLRNKSFGKYLLKPDLKWGVDLVVKEATKEGILSMTGQKLIDLPEIRLPRDLAWRVKFIQAVEEHMRHLGVDGKFQAPRFFGYYFCGRHPVVLARHWKVTLDAAPLLTRLKHILEGLTDEKYSIAAKSEESAPDYLLVHDRHDGACWLWGFAEGRRFVESHEPVANLGSHHDETVEGEEDSGRKLMG